MATSAVLFGGGDLIAQQAIEKKGLQAHDVRNISSMAGIACLMVLCWHICSGLAQRA